MHARNIDLFMIGFQVYPQKVSKQNHTLVFSSSHFSTHTVNYNNTVNKEKKIMVRISLLS